MIRQVPPLRAGATRMAAELGRRTPAEGMAILAEDMVLATAATTRASDKGWAISPRTAIVTLVPGMA